MSLPTVTCLGCAKGIEMCKVRPCWGTPEEIQKIIKAGLGGRLMGDYWVGELNGQHSPTIVSPAIVGHEGQGAPESPFGRCTFLTAEDKCGLHDLGLKPTEGAVACCKLDTDQGVHRKMAESWATPEAQAMARDWEACQ